MGIVGRDQLLESGAEVYELVDLGFGTCKMVVASPSTATAGNQNLLWHQVPENRPSLLPR